MAGTQLLIVCHTSTVPKRRQLFSSTNTDGRTGGRVPLSVRLKSSEKSLTQCEPTSSRLSHTFFGTESRDQYAQALLASSSPRGQRGLLPRLDCTDDHLHMPRHLRGDASSASTGLLAARRRGAARRRPRQVWRRRSVAALIRLLGRAAHASSAAG